VTDKQDRPSAPGSPGSQEPLGAADGSPPPPAAPVETEVVAYAEDCRISGRLELSGDRLTDTLSRQDRFVLRDASVEALADGRMIAAGEVPVTRDELLAVHAAGPSGNPSRHLHTRRYPVVVRSGPYVIRGYMHTPPAVRPEESTKRRVMLPLSDAWVEYMVGGIVQRSPVGTIVVNRNVADSVDFASDEDVVPPAAGPGAGMAR
jgi:hypothetical protein